MKTLKDYSDFLKKEEPVNEGLKDTFKNFWQKIKDKWGNKAWEKYLVFLDKAGKLISGSGKRKIYYSFPTSGPTINLDKIDISAFEGKTGDLTPYLKSSLMKESSGVLYEQDAVDLKSKDTSVPDYTIQDLEETIFKFFKMRKTDPEDMCSLFIWGAPGIAKTSIVKQCAEKLGVPSITWMLSQIEPSDFAGLPTVVDQRTHFALPAVFPSDETSPNGGIIFLDELNRADQAVLAASLSLCLEGRIGYDYRVPKGWLIIAAGNRKEDVVGGRVTKIEPALSNRFAHVNLIYSVDDFARYSVERGVKTIHPDILGFLMLKQDKLHHLDPNLPVMNWPSPRRWEKLSKEYIFDLEERGKLKREEVIKIAAKHVGPSVAGEFADYLDVRKYFSERDIQGVYEGKDIKWPKGLNINENLAIISFIAFYKKGKQVTEKELENIFNFAVKMNNFELATTLIQFFVQVHPYVQVTYKDLYKKLVKEKWFNYYRKELTI